MTTAITASAAVLFTRYGTGSLRPVRRQSFRVFSSASESSARGVLQPPDVPRLADTARISLSPQELQEFAPKIRQVVDWFGQLQAINLESIEPSLRADTEVGMISREDIPEIFENRDGMIAAVPSYDDPYIKVPKVLNKQ